MSGKINVAALNAKRSQMDTKNSTTPAPAVQTNVFGNPLPQVQNNPFLKLPPSPGDKNPFAKKPTTTTQGKKSFNPFAPGGQQNNQQHKPLSQINFTPSPLNFQPQAPKFNFTPSPQVNIFQKQAPQQQQAPTSQPIFTFNNPVVAAQRRQLEEEIALLEGTLQARRFELASLENPQGWQNGWGEPMDWEPTPAFHFWF